MVVVVVVLLLFQQDKLELRAQQSRDGSGVEWSGDAW